MEKTVQKHVATAEEENRVLKTMASVQMNVQTAGRENYAKQVIIHVTLFSFEVKMG
jgi:hypothetical protein